MDFFTHPWYMAAGGAAVSLPILIHLINRLRFRRIRWAAMEFLLKSEKRTRRPLIVKQLILLLLRILMMLLLGFLVARFLPVGAGARGATHVVILDDSLSMSDVGKAGNKEATAYSVGIGQIRKVVENANKAASVQNLHVILLSEAGQPQPFYEGKISDATMREVEAKFLGNGNKPSLMHVKPLRGVQKARQMLTSLSGEQAQGARNIYLISDFRDADWTSDSEAEKMTAEVKGAVEDGINVYLIDAATPYRDKNQKTALYNDNLAVTELKADTRVAIEESDVEFTASVMNYGSAEGGNRQLKVYVNGEHAQASDQIIEKLPAGTSAEVKFTLRFPKKPGKNEITEKDGPAERERKRRLDREYYHIRVTIPKDVNGLQADNVRDLVVEVRKKVPSLFVDGNKPENRTETGDMSHLQAFYAASGVYEIEELRLDDLEKADLDLYPSIFLLNVAEIPPPVVAKLKQYVENGGSLCYFLGEEVKPDHYNTELFKAGIFPIMMRDRPFDPLAAAFGDVDLRQKERERLRQIDRTPKILFPKADHPLVARLAPFRGLFRFLSINVYWQALPRSQWDPEPQKAETLVVLPNSRPIDEYKGRAIELANKALQQTTALANKEKEIQKYVGPVEEIGRAKIRVALSAGEMYQLAEALDELLTSPGVKDDPKRPDMKGLWNHVDMKALETEIKEFREGVLYGDPLVVSKTVGKGRVVAMLTPAGTSPRRGGAGEDLVQWNNWGAGEKLVSQTYPLFLLDMQRYLVSEGQAPNRLLGEEVNFAVDVTRYDPKVSWTFTPQPEAVEDKAAKLEPRKDKTVMTKDGNRLLFSLKDATVTQPGVFNVTLTHLGDGPEEDRQERRSYAYNVDALSESNLKRATKDRLVPDTITRSKDGNEARGSLALVLPEGGATDDPYTKLQQKQPDASEWSLLYLFIIIVLVVEQALAVHLSHHTRGGQVAAGTGPPQAAAAA